MEQTVEAAVEKQRNKIDFDPIKLSQFLYGRQFYHKMLSILNTKQIIPLDFNLFNRGRVEVIKQAIRDSIINYHGISDPMNNDAEMTYYILNCINQMPGSVHIGMFMRCLELMGTEDQCQQYWKKGKNFQYVGCYAQTEIAHGSDVSSLMTTAVFDESRDSFILNSPDIKSIKFWPGDLGIFATHALVYANLTVKGKSHGIQSFIVPIRHPQTLQLLEGIDAGDIGPKIGFLSKDNGYLILNNVNVPRRNMLAKFFQVSKTGETRLIGDPKVSYAAMMEIRKHISCTYPKIYSSAITIATRYSIFRRQFKNSRNQEIKIIDYQLQQDKIINRVAEYYAINAAGNNISKLCDRNLKLVNKRKDFSLMAQTHACLCLGKPMISEIVYDGMQICRKACGGHGFSQYSGFPFLINEYACHLTHEGENTVLYLQVARYLMKSYKHFMTKKKTIGESVKYIESYDYLMAKKCQVDDPSKWTMEDIRVVFAQAVCHLLSVVTEKMMSKDQSVSVKDMWNYEAGIRLKQLAQMHAVYYIFNSLRQAVSMEKNERIKEITTNLCLLFGVNMAVSFSSPIIEAGHLTGQQYRHLTDLKQVLLKRIRPILIGIVDGFGIPDKYIRSALMRGNPYENYLKLAQENQLNHQRLESVRYVKEIGKHLKNPNPTF